VISTNDFRSGQTILYGDEPYVILESMHVKPGKGQAFVRSKLKNLVTAWTLIRTSSFRSTWSNSRTLRSL